MATIDHFDHEHGFLSNFYASHMQWQHPYQANVHVWATVEHAFQAAKTTKNAEIEKIRLAHTPGQAKRLGRQATLRPDWNQIRDEVMKDLCVIKFANPYLREKLLGTVGSTLVEGNTWHDNYWGDCRCGRIACKGEGHNMLGRILMHVRAHA